MLNSVDERSLELVTIISGEGALTMGLSIQHLAGVVDSFSFVINFERVYRKVNILTNLLLSTYFPLICLQSGVCQILGRLRSEHTNCNLKDHHESHEVCPNLSGKQNRMLGICLLSEVLSLLQLTALQWQGLCLAPRFLVQDFEVVNVGCRLNSSLQIATTRCCVFPL